MKLVIDIDSYVLEHCKRHVKEHYANNIEEAIANGTPLPKGHGRLIECERLQEVFRRNVVGYAGFKQLFDIAPTIIAKDGE